jgi:hypothetical protein
MKKKKKQLWEMNAVELAQATREFDEEFVADKARPLSAAGKARHRRAARAGRPRVGRGSQRINITFERGLLSRADKMAQLLGLTRSQLLARALENALAVGRA